MPTLNQLIHTQWRKKRKKLHVDGRYKDAHKKRTFIVSPRKPNSSLRKAVRNVHNQWDNNMPNTNNSDWLLFLLFYLFQFSFVSLITAYLISIQTTLSEIEFLFSWASICAWVYASDYFFFIWPEFKKAKDIWNKEILESPETWAQHSLKQKIYRIFFFFGFRRAKVRGKIHPIIHNLVLFIFFSIAFLWPLLILTTIYNSFTNEFKNFYLFVWSGWFYRSYNRSNEKRKKIQK